MKKSPKDTKEVKISEWKERMKIFEPMLEHIEVCLGISERDNLKKFISQECLLAQREIVERIRRKFEQLAYPRDMYVAKYRLSILDILAETQNQLKDPIQ
jgi:hypothetical protein